MAKKEDVGSFRRLASLPTVESDKYDAKDSRLDDKLNAILDSQQKYLLGVIFPRVDIPAPSAAVGAAMSPLVPPWVLAGDMDMGMKSLLHNGVLVMGGPTADSLIVKETGEPVLELMKSFDRPLWREVRDGSQIRVASESAEGIFLVISGHRELGLPNDVGRWRMVKAGAEKDDAKGVIPVGWVPNLPPTGDSETGCALSPGPQKVCVVDLWLRGIPLHMMWLKNECALRQVSIKDGTHPSLLAQN
jgi:hypothetical protein